MTHDDPGTRIDRRRLLRDAAVGLALAGLPRTAFAAEEPSPLRLGFSLYGMKTLPVDDALRACARIGYSDVELALNPGYPTEPRILGPDARAAVRERLGALKLGLPALMINISLTADDKAHAESVALIGEATALGRELSPEAPPIIETVMGGKPAEWDDRKAGMAARLRDWAAAAEKAHATIALKAHVAGAVNSPERLLWLLDAVKSPALAVAYDYSHFALQGLDLETTLDALLPHTRFIHVKDAAGDPKKFQFLLPGEGTTDYARYFSLLMRRGYKGPVCVEVSSQVSSKPGYDPIGAATRSYAALSAALAKAGRG